MIDLWVLALHSCEPGALVVLTLKIKILGCQVSFWMQWKRGINFPIIAEHLITRASTALLEMCLGPLIISIL